MASSELHLQDVLAPEEAARIDRFCAGRAGEAALPAVAAFLEEAFGLLLTLDPDIVAGFAQDSSNLPGRASAVCRPKDERECALLLRACFGARIPLTLSAGRSNLTGSATPQGGAVLSTARMLTPAVRVDREAGVVRAPVGMILEDLRREVERQTQRRLRFPVDPTSRADASVGGAIACNASGFTPGEPGAMRHWVAGLDFLFPNGLKVSAVRGSHRSENGRFELVHGGERTPLPVPRHARPAIKNAGGPYSAPDGAMDFVDYVVGSEGIYGLVTACTLRLAERPRDYVDLFFSLATEAQAVDLAAYLRAHLDGGLGRLTALEYFGPNCRRYMDHETRFFKADHPVAVYVQVPVFDGTAAEDLAAQWLGLLHASGCGVDEDAVLLLDNERDRALFMEARHSLPARSLEVVQRRGTYTVMTDTVVPPDRFAAFLAFAHDAIRALGLDYLSFGHLGDCHLHFAILPDRAQLAAATELYDRLVAEAAALGGVYSGEHGTGKRKRADFLRGYGPRGVEEIRRSKAAIDPHFLFNRGNVIDV